MEKIKIVNLGHADQGLLIEEEDFQISGERAVPLTPIGKEGFRQLRVQLNVYASAAKKAGLPEVPTGPVTSAVSAGDRDRLRKLGRELPEEFETKSGNVISFRAEKAALQRATTIRATAERAIRLAQTLARIRSKLPAGKRRTLAPKVKIGLVGAGAAVLVLAAAARVG